MSTTLSSATLRRQRAHETSEATRRCASASSTYLSRGDSRFLVQPRMYAGQNPISPPGRHHWQPRQAPVSRFTALSLSKQARSSRSLLQAIGCTLPKPPSKRRLPQRCEPTASGRRPCLERQQENGPLSRAVFSGLKSLPQGCGGQPRSLAASTISTSTGAMMQIRKRQAWKPKSLRCDSCSRVILRLSV